MKSTGMNYKFAQWFWQVSKHLRTQSLINALIGIVTVGIDFAFIAATKLAIDIATGRNNTPLRWAAGILIAIVVAQIVIGFTRRWVGAILGVRSQNRMQQRLFRHILQSEWNGMEHRHSGDVLNRLERDVRDVTSVITDTMPAALGTSVRLLGAFFFLYHMDHTLAIIIVVIIPVFILLSRVYVKKMRTLTREIRQTDSEVQSILQESVQHRVVLKTLERTGTMAERLEDTQSHLRDQIRHRTLFSSFSGTLLNMGFATGYLITFLWGVSRLHDGTITYGMMIAFIQLVGQIQGPFREMTKFIPIIIGAFTAAERLIELEQIPTEAQGAPILCPTVAGIRIDHVSYSYDQRKRQILHDFSYDFPPGSITAVMGETGAGKTTLIRLILALLRPQSGAVQIYWQGQSHTVSPQTRCNLVYVPQGNTLFSGTIRDNLLLGNPDATEAEMQQALDMACAGFVMKRPNGLDELCGEGGAGLSEGQAQRIAIARALLRRGSILLFDEATSALDLDTERRLLQNLHTHTGGHTIIFITHRPAVVELCDQVLNIERKDIIKE